MSTSPTGWVPVDPPGPGAAAAVTGPSTDPEDGTGTPTGWVPAAPGDRGRGATPAPGASPTPGPAAGPAPAPTPTAAPAPAPAAPVPADAVDPAPTAAAPTADVAPDAAPTADVAPDAAPAAPAAPDDRQPAEVVRDAVLTAPGVVALSGGALGEVATFLPGRRVPGVRLGPGPGDPLEVHVVAAYGTPVAATAAAVRAALAGLPASAGVAGRPVHVVVDDVALPGAPGTDAGAAGPR